MLFYINVVSLLNFTNTCIVFLEKYQLPTLKNGKQMRQQNDHMPTWSDHIRNIYQNIHRILNCMNHVVD